MNVKYDHERDDHITSRLQPPQKGLALCLRCHPAWAQEHPCGSCQGHPRYTGAVTTGGRGWPDRLLRRQLCRIQTWWRSRFLKPQIYGEVASHTRLTRSRLMTNTASTQSKWRSPESSRTPRREKEPITQEKINQVTWNETKHIKIMQNQYTDQVVDVSVAIQRQVPQIQKSSQTSTR